MAYEFDLFVSYRHSTAAKAWVRETFVPELRNWLNESLPDPVSIFLDTESIRAGMNWHAALRGKLLASKCLVAVLNGPYFSSDYCTAEWHTFVEREKLLGLGTLENPRGLITPIRFFDGQHYAPMLGTKQALDMTSWASTARAFKDSPAYQQFEATVKALAEELAASDGPILSPPPHQHDWPVLFPREAAAPKMGFPAV